jgi:transcriptional regulator with XRE-family HTH domain
MLQTAQVRAARALIGWTQNDLAREAKVSIATIRRIESQEGSLTGYISTLIQIQSAFEQAGIRFLDNGADGGMGVRLAAPKP